MIWSREFSGARLDPAFWGCYAGIHPLFRTGKAETCLEPANGLGTARLPVEPGKGPGPPPCGCRWATESFIPLPSSPALSRPPPPQGAAGLEPFLPRNKQCVLRNDTQACDIYGYGVDESSCLGTSVDPWGMRSDGCHGA